jgi:uncharacterized membrane protein
MAREAKAEADVALATGFETRSGRYSLGQRQSHERRQPMLALWLIVLLLVVFGVIGGIAIGKFLFLILIAAAILALFGLFSRSTA